MRAATLRGLGSIALGIGLAGCTAAGSTSVTVTGKSLTIYASVPSAGGPQAQDVFEAEQLAFDQKQHEVTVGGFSLKLIRLATSSKLSNNPRTAIQDPSAIAYLGEIVPGASRDTAGITNAQDLLQVSPTDTALELTESTPAVSGAPNRYYESLKTYGRTFARVTPNTAAEAKAQVRVMQALHVHSLYVADDRSPYGRAVALAVKQAAPSGGITPASTPAGADAVFDGTSSASDFNKAAASPGVKLFGPSALAFTSGLTPAANNAYISEPGFAAKAVPPAGRKFSSDFSARYGHAPSAEAIFGYEAMSALLDVLHGAGSSANDRSKVVRDFFAIKNRPSVLGTYSISANGETSLTPFVFSRLRSGRLIPFKSLQSLGCGDALSHP